jgi:hypothetical protein
MMIAYSSSSRSDRRGSGQQLERSPRSRDNVRSSFQPAPTSASGKPQSLLSLELSKPTVPPAQPVVIVPSMAADDINSDIEEDSAKVSSKDTESGKHETGDESDGIDENGESTKIKKKSKRLKKKHSKDKKRRKKAKKEKSHRHKRKGSSDDSDDSEESSRSRSASRSRSRSQSKTKTVKEEAKQDVKETLGSPISSSEEDPSIQQNTVPAKEIEKSPPLAKLPVAEEEQQLLSKTEKVDGIIYDPMPVAGSTPPLSLLDAEQISPEGDLLDDFKSEELEQTDTSILLSPHTPFLPPKAYESYVHSFEGKRKAPPLTAEDEEDRKSRKKKRTRKDSESPKPKERKSNQQQHPLPTASTSATNSRSPQQSVETSSTKKVLPVTMGQMDATSFFAQLRRGRHGPIPRERSPSPLPVIVVPDENKNPEVFTIEDGQDESNSDKATPVDTIDGDGSRSAPGDKSQLGNAMKTSGTNNFSPVANLMQLPFPPGMEGMKGSNPSQNASRQVSSAQLALYGNIIGIGAKQKVMSITKDLPMPPGKKLDESEINKIHMFDINRGQKIFYKNPEPLERCVSPYTNT